MSTAPIHDAVQRRLGAWRHQMNSVSRHMDPRHKAEDDTCCVFGVVPAKIVILGLVPRIQSSANTGL